MELPPLFEGRILSRYKRFLADIELPTGEIVTAYCPNTGAMTGCWSPGAAVQVSASDNPKRKLKWTLERVDMGVGWVGVNTVRVNQFIRSFIEENAIPAFHGYRELKSEPVYFHEGFEKSRFDFRLSGGNRPDCYLEIKNATLFRDGRVLFPDAVTVRGRKHLKLLQHAVQQGHRGIMLFAVNRPEGNSFGIAGDIDPAYHQTLLEAKDSGVEIRALRLIHNETGVIPGEWLPLFLDW